MHGIKSHTQHIHVINPQKTPGGDRNGKENACEIKRLQCEIKFQSRIKRDLNMHGIKSRTQHIHAITLQKTSGGEEMKKNACEMKRLQCEIFLAQIPTNFSFASRGLTCQPMIHVADPK